MDETKALKMFELVHLLLAIHKQLEKDGYNPFSLSMAVKQGEDAYQFLQWGEVEVRDDVIILSPNCSDSFPLREISQESNYYGLADYILWLDRNYACAGDGCETKKALEELGYLLKREKVPIVLDDKEVERFRKNLTENKNRLQRCINALIGNLGKDRTHIEKTTSLERILKELVSIVEEFTYLSDILFDKENEF